MSSEVKSRAIVLHTTRQGDSSLVVHVLDETAGRQSLFLRGVGKGRRTSAAAAFHPLAVLEVVTDATPRSSLLYLREYEPLLPLPELRTDIRRSATAQFVCEVLWRTLRTGDGDPELFTWLVESIAALEAGGEGIAAGAAGAGAGVASDAGNAGVADDAGLAGVATNAGRPLPGIANFAVWWLVGYCSRMGFRPEDNWEAGEAPIFNIVSGRVQADFGWFAPRGQKEPDGESAFRKQELRLAETVGADETRVANPDGLCFSTEESLLLHRFLTLSFDEAMALPLSAARRNAFSRRMLTYLSHHLGQSLEIRSLDVLHAVFAD